MDCRTFHRKLEDYLQGGLDFTGRFSVERHAQQCFGCGRAMQDAIRLGQTAREMKRVKAPPDFESALMARIQREQVPRRRSVFWKAWVFGLDPIPWRTAALGAAAMVLVGVGVLVFMRNGPFHRPLSAERDGALPAAEDVAKQPDSKPAAPPPWNADSTRTSPDVLNPRIIPVGNSSARFLLEEEWAAPFLDATDLGYVEYPVPGPGNRLLIMRLPRSIRMRYSQPSEEYFLRNVSH
jgi:hypothetical protein